MATKMLEKDLEDGRLEILIHHGCGALIQCIIYDLESSMVEEISWAESDYDLDFYKRCDSIKNRKEFFNEYKQIEEKIAKQRRISL